MNELIRAINAGKIRGYEERRNISGEEVFFQCAIKKQNDVYCTYFFVVEVSRMDLIEDDENEEVKTHFSLDAALEYLVGKGAVIEKFAVIRKTLPF